MVREVPKQKTARALRKLARVARQAEETGTELTRWEQDFVSGVTGRLSTYGSAFRDPQKGALEEPLSQRQSEIVRLLNRKSRRKKQHPCDAAPLTGTEAPRAASPKPRKPLKTRKPLRPRRPARSRPPESPDE
jgi:hypothetical protein